MNTTLTMPRNSAPHRYDHDYWAQRFPSEPYRQEGDRFDEFEPAYRFGHSLSGRIGDFERDEAQCQELWKSREETSALSWERARPAARTAWYRAQLFEHNSKIETALRRGREDLQMVWGRLEEKVRQRPTGYVLGAAATGYLSSRLPVRSMLMTAIGVVSAAAPSALLVLGLWKVADHFLSEKRRDGRPARPDGPHAAPERGNGILIVTDTL